MYKRMPVPLDSSDLALRITGDYSDTFIGLGSPSLS